MDLEVVNMLYLELSQFATAKTGADIALANIRKVSDRRYELLRDIYNCNTADMLPTELKARIHAELFPFHPEGAST